jgi:deazaflavin-dependent oxidoreductase (nitroreductase family)
LPYARPVRPRSAWDRFLRAEYRLIRLVDPIVRPIWHAVGLADTEELVVVGRRSGRPRPVMVGLLRVGGQWYVGHPNGEAAQWVRNLAAAGQATIRFRDGTTVAVRASALTPGPERDRVIPETYRQHAFPGNVVYYLARHYIAVAGLYFRLDLDPGGTDPGA